MALRWLVQIKNARLVWKELGTLDPVVPTIKRISCFEINNRHT